MLPAFTEKWRVYKPGLVQAQVMVAAKKKRKNKRKDIGQI